MMNRNRISIIRRFLLNLVCVCVVSLPAAADVTLTGWGKASCTTNPLPAFTYNTGNRLCAQGPVGNACKGTAQPSGSTVPFTGLKLFTGAYLTGRISPNPSSTTMTSFNYTCAASGATLTCTPTDLITVYYGSGCTGPSLQVAGDVSGVAPVVVNLPADASQLSYGTNSHGICYRTGTPSAVQCRAVTVNYTNGNALPVISWGFGSPVTMFTASELDNDGDTTNDEADTDDDNDGLPDVMDPLPLQSQFNLDAPYKGSRLQDQSAVE